MNGSRSAATIGGRIAFRIAISSAATTAPPKPSTETPGTIAAATSSAAALSEPRERRARTGRNLGRSGCQVICSPYVRARHRARPYTPLLVGSECLGDLRRPRDRRDRPRRRAPDHRSGAPPACASPPARGARPGGRAARPGRGADLARALGPPRRAVARTPGQGAAHRVPEGRRRPAAQEALRPCHDAGGRRGGGDRRAHGASGSRRARRKPRPARGVRRARLRRSPGRRRCTSPATPTCSTAWPSSGLRRRARSCRRLGLEGRPGASRPRARGRGGSAACSPKIAVPIHWGTFAPIGRVPDLESPHEFARLVTDVEVRILEPGETLELERGEIAAQPLPCRATEARDGAIAARLRRGGDREAHDERVARSRERTSEPVSKNAAGCKLRGRR